MEEVKVSVIMPVYNAEPYLEETLESLSAQTYRNVELFFVDDGSTDRSVEIIRQYIESHPEAHLLQQEHQFAGVARNYGMQYAQGDYLLFLDADDLFYADMIESAVARAEETNADICVFQGERYDQQTGLKTKMRWVCDPRLCPEDADTFSRHTNSKNIFCFTTAVPWNKLFRRSFVEANNLIFQNTQNSNDVAFVVTALAMADRIAVCDKVLLAYRANNTASLQGSKYTNPTAFFEARRELRKRLIDRNVFQEVEQAYVNFALDGCIYHLKTMKTQESFEETYDLLKNGGLAELDLLRWPEEYFSVKPEACLFENREAIMELTAEEYEKRYQLLAYHVPAVSVVIPVYNVELYLRECLDSVLNQTLQDIEIICVDDASTDASPTILQEYEERYENIKCVYFKERRTAAQARRTAILLSTGKTIMFVDSDDFLEKNACGIACAAIKRKHVEILQFGTIVENCGNLPESRITSNQKALDKKAKDMVIGDLLHACFVNKLFGFTIWNKIYDGNLCRAAAAKIEDGPFPKANDLYLAFFLLEGAESYCSIPDVLYHYCLGRGMTGHNYLDEDAYRLCCRSTLVYRALERYVRQVDLKEARNYTGALESIKKLLLAEQRGKFANNVLEENKIAALRIFREAWGTDYAETLGNIYPALRYRRTEVAGFCRRHKEELGLTYEPHAIKAVALYYRNIVNGGAQRVVAILANQLAEYEENGKKKYQVYLVTCEEASPEDEYPLSPYVVRCSIPSSNESEQNYTARAQAITAFLDTHHIDAFIDSRWIEPLALWDLLCVKQHPSHPAFFVHQHEFSGAQWGSSANRASSQMEFYSLADGIITLSEADRYYCSMINPHVRFIGNPCFITKTEKNRRSTGNNIVWLARISQEKKPLELLKIIELVKQEIPEVHCSLVGDGTDVNLKKKIETYSAEHHLEDNVTLEGFHLDVEPFYQNSDVFVLTSKAEGFGLTLFEAAAHGIPTVTYDLPWLAYYDVIDGWDSVPQGDAEAAAKKIAAILRDGELWETKSRAIYDSFLEYNEHNIIEDWVDFFHQYETDSFPPVDSIPGNIARILLYNIGVFHTDLVQKLNEKMNTEKKKKEALEENNKKLQRTIDENQRAVKQKVTELARKDKELAKKERQRRKLKRELLKKKEELDKKNEELAHKDEELAHKDEELDKKERQRRKLKRELVKKSEGFDEKNEELRVQIQQLEERELELNKIKKRLSRSKMGTAKLQREINEVHASTSYRVGRALTWLPRKIRTLFRS